jgi:hypothetical protein
MGFIDSKFVAKFIAGGAAPALPPTHTPGPASPIPPQHASLSPPTLPPGWVEQWDTKSRRIYYLDQATGRTQWVPPAHRHDPVAENDNQLDSSAASMMSSTTAHTTTPLISPGRPKPKQHDIVRRNHVYLNLPTASERAEILRKAEEKRQREGEKPYVTKSTVLYTKELIHG